MSKYFSLRKSSRIEYYVVAIVVLATLFPAACGFRIIFGLTRDAVLSLKSIAGPWNRLKEWPLEVYHSSNFTISERTNFACDNLNHSSLPSVIENLRMARRYTCVLERGEASRCCRGWAGGGLVTSSIRHLIHCLVNVARRCEIGQGNDPSCGTVRQTDMPRRVDTWLMDAQDVFIP